MRLCTYIIVVAMYFKYEYTIGSYLISPFLLTCILVLYFSMVLNAKSLMKNMGLTSSDVESMRLQSKFYSYLDSERSNAYNAMCNRRKERVKEAERCHYETFDYKQIALDGKRGVAITYLEKWNDVASGATLRSVATKAAFIKKKRERIAKYQELERSKRCEAKDKKTQPLLTGDEAEDEDPSTSHDVPASSPMMIKDETYYELLGVSPTAEAREIEQAFRKVSLTCHPDRCSVSAFFEYDENMAVEDLPFLILRIRYFDMISNEFFCFSLHFAQLQDPNARDRFNKLAEAKEVLSCPIKRQAYDAELARSAD